MDNKCIVSFGKGHNFERGVDRLQNYVSNLVKIPFFGFKEYPKYCPTHQESPFAFKFYCIQECYKKEFTSILWLDSSVIIKNDLSEVFNYIDTQGYFFIKNWHSCGMYCHDKALITLGITREDSFNIPSIQGTNFGLNLSFEKSRMFLNILLGLSTDGITFPGPCDNENFHASKNLGVKGHRHEQTAMSIIALKLGMNNWWVQEEHKWFIHDRQYVKQVAGTTEDIDMSNNE